MSNTIKKDIQFTIRSGIEKTRGNTYEVLNKQISSPSFPITVNAFSAKIKFCDYKIGRDFYIDKVRVKTISLNLLKNWRLTKKSQLNLQILFKSKAKPKKYAYYIKSLKKQMKAN